jgi:hypothetical protein
MRIKHLTWVKQLIKQEVFKEKYLNYGRFLQQ